MAQGNILIERNDRSLRIYQKESLIFMLCDFCPIQSKFMRELEKLGMELEQVTDYEEADMGVVIIKGQLEKTISSILDSDIL